MSYLRHRSSSCRLNIKWRTQENWHEFFLYVTKLIKLQQQIESFCQIIIICRFYAGVYLVFINNSDRKKQILLFSHTLILKYILLSVLLISLCYN